MRGVTHSTCSRSFPFTGIPDIQHFINSFSIIKEQTSIHHTCSSNSSHTKSEKKIDRSNIKKMAKKNIIRSNSDDGSIFISIQLHFRFETLHTIQSIYNYEHFPLVNYLDKIQYHAIAFTFNSTPFNLSLNNAGSSLDLQKFPQKLQPQSNQPQS